MARLNENRLFMKELMDIPVAAADGVPPGACGGRGFGPEAENGGRDARAPKTNTSL
jgi:hypothetical protein